MSWNPAAIAERLDEITRLAAILAIRNRSDRDEILQDLVLILLLDGNSYDAKRGSLFLWLNWRWKNLNRKNRPLQLLSTEHLTSFQNQVADPSHEIVNREETDRLTQRLELLGPADRWLLEHSFGILGARKITLAEMARHRSCTPQWVSRCRSAALEKLRKSLQVPTTSDKKP